MPLSIAPKPPWEFTSGVVQLYVPHISFQTQTADDQTFDHTCNTRNALDALQIAVEVSIPVPSPEIYTHASRLAELLHRQYFSWSYIGPSVAFYLLEIRMILCVHDLSMTRDDLRRIPTQASATHPQDPVNINPS